MKSCYLIVSEKSWNKDMHLSLANEIDANFILISNREDFTLDRVKEIDPDRIFFPHWSYIIPSEIFENFNCIVMHMTDLPFGRGGSPLQNLIVRGKSDTKISALRVEAGVDAGPIYLKKDLSLHGSAQDIFIRASAVIEGMIKEIIINNPMPVAQSGTPTFFKRRQPAESDLFFALSSEEVFDKIRMLDAEGYPHAYLAIENFVVRFTGVEYVDGQLCARAVFEPNEQQGEEHD